MPTSPLGNVQQGCGEGMGHQTHPHTKVHREDTPSQDTAAASRGQEQALGSGKQWVLR